MRRATFLSLTLSLAALACGTVDDLDSGEEEEMLGDGKADFVSYPVGTFRRAEAQAGQFVTLTLKTDRTFHAETLVYCITAPCDPIANEGTYLYTRSGNIRYIRLYDGDGMLIDRYAWRLSGDELSLRKAYTTTWYTLTHAAEAWCGEPADCELQDLMHPMCVGQWTCGEHACAYSCEPPTGAGCEAAGGTCMAVTPDACADGVIGAADKFACGAPGTVGSVCCLPPSACKPVCDAAYTWDEGWYDGCTGELLCYAWCAGAEASCGAVGSRSEGWYADDGFGCDGSGRIEWAMCH